MARGTYLRKRPQGWIFRRAIPQDLQARFGGREIVRSLAHLPQSRAAYEARALGFACEELFMEARQDPSLDKGRLQKFAAAIVANKPDHLATFRPPLRMRGENPHEIFEHYRDVATSSAEAAVGGQSVFQVDAVLRFAAEAGIPKESALEAMPMLQGLLARTTAAYCAQVAENIRPDRPRKRGVLERWCTPEDDAEERYRTAFRQLSQVKPLIRREESPSSTVPAVSEARSSVSPTFDDESESPGHVDPVVHSHHLERMIPRGSDVVPSAPTVSETEVDRISEPSAEPSASSTQVGTDLRFSAQWDAFIEDRITVAGWSETRRPELAGTLRLVLRLLGDVSLATLTREQAVQIRSRFLCLPCDHKNLWFDREKGRERSFDELLCHVRELEQVKSLRFVVPKTWNRHCGVLSSFVEFMKVTKTDAKDIENPFSALFVAVKKDSATIKLEREMAPTFALRALFQTEVWTGRARIYHLKGRGRLIVRDSLYWIPLMEVCLGVRREEAAQLRVRHITRKFEYLGVNLFAEDIRVKKKEGASRRWIPLSRAILDLGFVKCLISGRGPDELLFPELSNDNAHEAFGESFGKRFLNYVKTVEVDLLPYAQAAYERADVPEGDKAALVQQELQRLAKEFREKVSNHAIRHWFRTIAENTEAKTLFIDELMGHEGDQASEGTSRYFKEAFVFNLKRTIDMVPVPFDPQVLRRLAEESESLHPELVEMRRQIAGKRVREN